MPAFSYMMRVACMAYSKLLVVSNPLMVVIPNVLQMELWT